MYVSVHVDMRAIRALQVCLHLQFKRHCCHPADPALPQLEITLDSIAHSIATAPRLKIRAAVSSAVRRFSRRARAETGHNLQDITVKKTTDEIHIVAHHANAEDRMPAYRRIMWLRRVLPGIAVKVSFRSSNSVLDRAANLGYMYDRACRACNEPSFSRRLRARTCSSKEKVSVRL